MKGVESGVWERWSFVGVAESDLCSPGNLEGVVASGIAVLQTHKQIHIHTLLTDKIKYTYLHFWYDSSFMVVTCMYEIVNTCKED